MASSWVNFAEIRSRVSLEDVLFGLYRLNHLKRAGDKVTGPCPIHGGDNPRGFSADLSKNVWHCFTRCRKGGNAIDFTAAMDKTSIRDAALKLQAYFLEGKEPAGNSSSSATPATPPKPGGVHPQIPSPTREPERDRDPARNPTLDLILKLKPEHPHLTLERGLKPETIEYFGVGYCTAGTLRGMIAIPIHSSTGELVAFAGRRLKREDIAEHGKYKLPKNFRKELELYNYHRAKEQMTSAGVILVEGFFTVMKLFEYGFRNVVAAMGSDVSDAQIELLAHSPEVIILFDGDEAGRRGGETAYAALNDRTKARIIELPADTEPEGHEPRTLRWAVNGVRQVGIHRLSFSLRE